MEKKIEATHEVRKAWSTPTLRRLSAGSAEARTGTQGDGGGPGANRS
jgi:hypothetical protein